MPPPTVAKRRLTAGLRALALAFSARSGMEASSRKRAAEGEMEGAPSLQKQASGGAPAAAAQVEFPSGDFSSWALDAASGWYRSPDGAWSYNSANFIFFHSATSGYYTYDAAQQSYVSVSCEYGADGQLHVVQPQPQPVAESPPEFAISVEGATMQGRRQKQEDRFTIVADMRATLAASGCAAAPPLPAAFCGVYDGHAGHDTSEYVAEQLHKDIAASLAAKQTAAAAATTTAAAGSDAAWADELVVAAIKEGYAKTDATFLNWARPRRRKDGSTAVTALLLGQKLYLAWLGDSRALLLNGSNQQLGWASLDHKPNRPDEMERVKKAGGTCLNMQGCWRVSTPAGLDYMQRRAKGRINPGEKAPNQLAVSRAFGDIELKEPMRLVSVEPEVVVHDLSRAAEDNDKGSSSSGSAAAAAAAAAGAAGGAREPACCVVLACDGIFDVMGDSEAGTLVARHFAEGGGVREGAGALIKRAFAKKSDDNLTAIVAVFDYGEGDPRSSWLGKMREKQAEASAKAQREEDLRRVKAEIQEMKQQLHGQARGAKGGLGTGANVPI